MRTLFLGRRIPFAILSSVLFLTACRGLVLSVSTDDSGSPTVGEGSGRGRGDAPPPVGVPPPPEQSTVTYLGRTLGLDPNHPDHVVLSWSGVAAGVRFEGTGIVANFANSQLPDPPSTNGQGIPMPRINWYNVYVDGMLSGAISVHHNADANIPLAQNLDDGSHTVWLVKRTEGWIGVNGFLGFSVASGGNLLTPPPRPLRAIEVLGASVETGYGVGGAHCDGNLAFYQDGEQSWTSLVGQSLGRDIINLSYLGHGLEWSNNGSYPVGYSPSEYYLETEYSAPGHSWDANQRDVSAIIIGLFNSDWSFLGDDPPPKKRFSGLLLSLVNTMVRLHPEAFIYLIISSTFDQKALASAQSYLETPAQDANAAGISRVRVVTFQQVVGNGCWGHPDPNQQAAMQNAFLPVIRGDLGWG